MPPRRSSVAPSQPSLPGPMIGGTRTQPSRQAQTRAPAVDHAEGEFFNLADVSPPRLEAITRCAVMPEEL
jgi:hypothetical protein